MRKSLRLVAVVLLGGSAVAGQSALAQEAVSSTVDGTTISVGGGIQFLWLPDMKFTGAGKPQQLPLSDQQRIHRIRPAADAKIETQLGYWGGYRVSGSLRGFWSNLDDSDGRSCKGGCVVVDPSTGFVANGSSLSSIPTATSIVGAARSKRSFGGGIPSKCGPICFAPTICSSVPIYAASTRTTT
jgi:hypothetical protein